MMHAYSPKLRRTLSVRVKTTTLVSALLVSSAGFASGIYIPEHHSTVFRTVAMTDSRLVPLRHAINPAMNAIAGRPQGSAESKAKPDPRQLLDASLRGDLRMVQELVRQKVDIQFANSDGERALHMAASRGHLSVVIFLLNHGANMNARTVKNWIPLHHAVRFNHPAVANYLLAKGAPPYFRTMDGINSMGIAEAIRNPKMIDLVARYMKK